jgi:hypothetical protein
MDIIEIENNKHCGECYDYIYKTLIPQLKTCGLEVGEKLESFENCKFDNRAIKEYGSCILGMKKDNLEALIGDQYWYSIKGRAQASRVFDLKYNASNQRLIEINLLNDDVSINRTIPCFGCDDVYEKIRTKDKLKKMSFAEFHERYKGCFYGKQPNYLALKIDLEDKIAEDNYHFSYNKEIFLGKESHQLNFLFYPGGRMVDISHTADVLGRKLPFVY